MDKQKSKIGEISDCLGPGLSPLNKEGKIEFIQYCNSFTVRKGREEVQCCYCDTERTVELSFLSSEKERYICNKPRKINLIEEDGDKVFRSEEE